MQKSSNPAEVMLPRQAHSGQFMNFVVKPRMLGKVKAVLYSFFARILAITQQNFLVFFCLQARVEMGPEFQFAAACFLRSRAFI
jgi:hypothetical protein